MARPSWPLGTGRYGALLRWVRGRPLRDRPRPNRSSADRSAGLPPAVRAGNGRPVHRRATSSPGHGLGARRGPAVGPCPEAVWAGCV